MAKFRRMLAILLVLTMVFSMGEVLVLADSEVPDGTASEQSDADTQTAPEATGQPETTDEPEATEQPEVTEEPEATEKPEVTEQPAATEQPEATEEPTAPPETSEEPEPSATPEPSASPEPEHKVWPWTEPGNDVSELMDGGKRLTSGGSFYYSEGGLYLNGSLLASGNARSLNLADGWLYYTADNAVMRMSAGGGSAETVHTADAYIDQMYVMGQEIRYLSGGSLYSFDMTDGAVESLAAPAGVQKFIPTAYGNLFFTGSVFQYTLWAEQTQLTSGIANAWTDGEWLVVSVGGETMQTSLPALFQGSYSPQTYSLHQNAVQTVSNLSEEAQLAAENAYYDSAEYAAIEAMLRSAASDSGIMTISSSAVLTKPLSQDQLNIVQRAQQHAAIKWKCLAERYSWGGNDISYTTSNSYTDHTGKADITSVDGAYSVGKYLKGETYKGVPYSWPIGYGYVGWNVTLGQFKSAVNDPNSSFYTKYSTQERTAPYYGSDCSGFVSYAWDLPQRCTCTSMQRSYSRYIGESISQLEVGYAINNPSSHVMLVTDIGYNANGEVVSVEITEQTPPKMRVTVFGEVISGRDYDRHVKNLSNLQSYYLNGGYSIYARSCSSKPYVSAVEDVLNIDTPAAPSISLAPAGPNKVQVTLSHDKGGTIYYTTDGTTPTSSNGQKYAGPFTVESDKAVTLNAVAYVGDKAGYVLSKNVPHTANAPTLIIQGASDSSGVYRVKEGDDWAYYVASGSKLSFLVPSGASVYYAVDSEPTVDGSRVDSSTAIDAAEGKTLKAFVANQDSIPSAVTSFKIKIGRMYTVEVEDLYGLVTSQEVSDISGKVHVLEGQSISFTVAASKDGYELDHVMVDGEKKEAGTYTFNDNKDHKIQVVVKLSYNDVPAENAGNAWKLRAMEFVTAKGLMTGKDNGSFDPDGKTSRAMFITVLGRYAQYYDEIHNTNLAKLYVFTSDSTYKYVEAKDMNKDHRVGVTNGSYINVRQEATTKKVDKYNPYAQLKEEGMLIEVLGSIMSEGRIWFIVSYTGDVEGSPNQGYVCQTDGTKELLKVCNFSDITSENVAYCNGWVQWGYLNGLVEGYSAGQFGSNYAITRQDICVLMYNFLKNIVGISMSTDPTRASQFEDYQKADSYAKDAVAAMVNIGVISGDGKKLQLNAVATRAQVAKFFMNLDDYLSQY